MPEDDAEAGAQTGESIPEPPPQHIFEGYEPPNETLRERARAAKNGVSSPAAVVTDWNRKENMLTSSSVSGDTVRFDIPAPDLKRMWRFAIPGFILPAGLVAFVPVRHTLVSKASAKSLIPALVFGGICLGVPLLLLLAIVLHIAHSVTEVEASPLCVSVRKKRFWGCSEERMASEEVLDVLDQGISGGHVPEVNVVGRGGVIQFGRHLPRQGISRLADALRACPGRRFAGPRPGETEAGKENEAGDAGRSIGDAGRRSMPKVAAGRSPDGLPG